MDDEIEDIVGVVKYTDSQKTIASLAYSLDFTDITSSSRDDSEKNLSSSKNTYVIECDSEDSDAMSPLHECAIEKLRPLYERLDYADTDLSSAEIASLRHQSRHVTHCASTSYQTMTAKETFTQTSKTIIELAETEGIMRRINDSNNLQTQTSFMSITENRTVEYTIELPPDKFTGDFIQENRAITNNIQIECPQDEESADSSVSSNQGSQGNYQNGLGDSNSFVGDFENTSLELENETTIYPVSETDNDVETRVVRENSEASTPRSESSKEQVHIIDNNNTNKHVSEEKLKLFSEHSSNEEYEEFPSDIEEDSLMQDSPNIKNVKQPQENIFEVDCLTDNFDHVDIQRFSILTPLTEEGIKGESMMDLTDSMNNCTDDSVLIYDELLFTNDTGMKVKLLKRDEGDSFKLPPIHNKPLPIENQSCPNSPQMLESKNRWELSTKVLAAGESTLISGKNPDPPKKRNQDNFHLPPISKDALNTNRSEPPRNTATGDMSELSQPICIKERIKELKTAAGRSKQPWSYKQPSRSQNRNRGSSPSSTLSPDGRRDLATIAHLGCEALCLELLERLQSTSWSVVVETLTDLPAALNKFWGNITEMRIAELLRLVNVHVESPRPQVARTACSTVAAILKNTRYTKKPDFYETVALLLAKTGSYSRLVRQAANVALDNIVCAVDMSHALAALTVHGVDHKNGLVRCAAARLLVVCCALGGAGRKLLKARPPSAATARKQTLRALAVLLDDKSKQTREYAERLYAMLRPLPNFEAYYLTDVDLETASRHMKKYDRILRDLSNDAR